MTINRRHLLTASAATVAAAASASVAFAAPAADAGLDGRQLGLRSSETDDQTAALQRAIDQAASARLPLLLPPGTLRAAGLILPAGVQISGVPGATRLVANRPKPILASTSADNVRLAGIAFDGGGQALPKNSGLVTLANGERVRVTDCEFIGASAYALMLDRIGGEVTGCTHPSAPAMPPSSRSMRAVSPWRVTASAAPETMASRSGGAPMATTAASLPTTASRKSAARDGGTGQNGNGINVFRAGNVTVRGQPYP